MTRAPSRIDKYEIVRRLGSGGMGTVYLARDAGLGREVAIKVLRGPVFDTDDELLARFLQEARATAKLRHTNIVTVYEVGQHDQQPFIVMEYVAGDSLAAIIQQRRPLPLAAKLHYLEQVCAGLHFAHRGRIVHRDIKPANLMVDTEGIVRVLDFGIARLEGSGMTRDGDMMGTVNYMSPEQMLGKRVDHRSDIFAVGAVAYELIAYRQAFPGTMNDGLLQRLPNDAPEPLSALCPDVDAELEALVNAALEKAPDARPPDLARVQAALAACRRRTVQQRGAAFEVRPAPPLVGLAATLHRPRPRTDDDEIRSELEEAERRLQAGDPTSAVDLAERVIQKAPSSVDAHALLLRAHNALAMEAAVGVGPPEAPADPVPDTPGLPRWIVPAAGAALIAVAAAIGSFSALLDRRDTAAPSVESTPAAPADAGRTAVGSSDAGADRKAGDVSQADADLSTRDDTDEETGIGTSVEIAVEPQLDRARALLRNGDAAGAAGLLEPLFVKTRDGRVRTLLDAAVGEVSSRVERARANAVNANARELAPPQLALAIESAQLMDRARRRNDYGETTRLALDAVRQFEEATTEAGRETARRAENASAPRPVEPATPSIVPGSSPDLPAPAPPPVATTTSNTTPADPPPAPVVSPLERERPGIVAALEEYRNAYRNRSVTDMVAVYPELPRERRQSYEKAFRNRGDCRALDVEFGQPQIFLGDAGQAHVTVMSTYVCTPVTGQRDPQEPQADVFQMRKSGDRWVITAMGEITR